MIATLSMMKMEKNFIAYLEKKYPRMPYKEYPIFIRNNNERTLIGFVWREMIELNKAVDLFDKTSKHADIPDQIIKAMWEVADVSNTLDYLFEGLAQALKDWEGDL